MSDPLMALTAAAAVLAGLTFLLSRVVPDRYDHVSLRRIEPRRDDRL
jgi:hypothetical protein